METIKAYTDLQQSKKLAEILPLESADMCYKCLGEDPYDIVMRPYTDWKEEYKGLLIRGDANVIPCWSLAALFKLFPKSAQLEKGNVTELYRVTLPVELEASDWHIEPIDACYKMIIRLNEFNLL